MRLSLGSAMAPRSTQDLVVGLADAEAVRRALPGATEVGGHGSGELATSSYECFI